MTVFPGLLERWRRYRFQRVMKRVRDNCTALGFPLDHLTDAEIVERLTAIGAVFRSFGITVPQAAAAFTRLRIALKELEDEASTEGPPTGGSPEALRRLAKDLQDRPESEP